MLINPKIWAIVIIWTEGDFTVEKVSEGTYSPQKGNVDISNKLPLFTLWSKYHITNLLVGMQLTYYNVIVL